MFSFFIFFLNIYFHVIIELTTSEKKKNDVVDLTDEDFGPEAEVVSKADTKEVTISPLSEKTFPSLVVIARPNMSPKQFTNQQVQAERASLGTFL